MKAFFDSNILVYAFADPGPRQERALALLGDGGTISVQCLNEFTSVARRKAAMSWDEIAEARRQIQVLCGEARPLSTDTHVLGVLIAERYKLAVYDAMIVSAALEAGCALVYSQDMHHGLVVQGSLTIVDPFR